MSRCSILLLIAVVAAGIGAACNSRSGGDSGTLKLHWEFANRGGGTFLAKLTLESQGEFELPPTGWALYFNSVRFLQAGERNRLLRCEHVNGDFFRLVPTEAFPGLEPGGTLVVEFTGDGAVINPSDCPSGAYILLPGREPVPIPDAELILPRRPEELRRSPEDIVPVPTPDVRYERQSALHSVPETELPLLIPTPRQSSRRPGAASVTVTSSWTIHYAEALEFEAAYLAQALRPFLGEEPTLVPDSDGGGGPERIVLRLEPGSGRAENYRLAIDPETGIMIAGSDPAGVFYGIQSLRALVPVEQWRRPNGAVELPAVTLDDGPRFPYRGLHLDVSRNFHSLEELRKLVELLAFYKLNRLHLHLSDDEGWRLEIPGLPELTQVGARRGHTEDESDRLVPSWGSGPFPDQSPGSGYYSRSDFIEFLRYATERHIQVIPEFDFPGHARAAIKSMEAREHRLQNEGQGQDAARYRLRDPDDTSEYRSVQGWNDNVVDVCLDSTYAFLDQVFQEVKAMYAEAGAPLEVIHVGGDEVPAGVWEGSPACRALAEQGGPTDKVGRKNYFLKRVADLLRGRGLELAGWEEVALVGETHGPSEEKVPNPEFLPYRFRAYVWNSVWGWGGEQNAYLLANAGYPVVLCNASNVYFDMAYEKHPDETALYWAGFTDTRTAWEFRPLNLYLGAHHDIMGRPISPADYAQAVRLTPAGKERILGIQGELWSEFLRTPERVEYMAFPKLLGLAERAWAPAPSWAAATGPAAEGQQEEDWNRFANAVGRRELPRLDYLAGGVAYRLPPPGAVVRDGKLYANVAFPGLVVRYTLDGTDPTPESPEYTGPVDLPIAHRARTTESGARAGETVEMARSLTVKLRTFDTRGRGSRVVTVTVE
ncbi:MAG: family 20 glycosylhydrolase [Acidobacteriota bacterium]